MEFDLAPTDSADEPPVREPSRRRSPGRSFPTYG